jgi:hypothetical protein
MTRLSAALCAVFFLFLAALSAVQSSAATIGIVRGAITVDGKPAANATVTLEGEGSKFTTKTDASGNYSFATIPYGNYRLTASAPGAHELQTFVTVISDNVTNANLALTTNLKEIAHTTVTAHAGAAGNPVAVNILDKSTIQTSPTQDSLNKTLETLP